MKKVALVLGIPAAMIVMLLASSTDDPRVWYLALVFPVVLLVRFLRRRTLRSDDFDVRRVAAETTDPAHVAAALSGDGESKRTSGENAIDEGSDLVRLGTFFTATEAYILQGCLEAEGIPSFVADVHTTQSITFLAFATGGVRVLVKESDLERARRISDAFKRGDYRLDDDHDVGRT